MYTHPCSSYFRISHTYAHARVYISWIKLESLLDKYRWRKKKKKKKKLAPNWINLSNREFVVVVAAAAAAAAVLVVVVVVVVVVVLINVYVLYVNAFDQESITITTTKHSVDFRYDTGTLLMTATGVALRRSSKEFQLALPFQGAPASVALPRSFS